MAKTCFRSALKMRHIDLKFFNLRVQFHIRFLLQDMIEFQVIVFSLSQNTKIVHSPHISMIDSSVLSGHNYILSTVDSTSCIIKCYNKLKLSSKTHFKGFFSLRAVWLRVMLKNYSVYNHGVCISYYEHL